MYVCMQKPMPVSQKEKLMYLLSLLCINNPDFNVQRALPLPTTSEASGSDPGCGNSCKKLRSSFSSFVENLGFYIKQSILEYNFMQKLVA